MKRQLMVTVDVEAQPKRSADDPLDRLIWGRFPDGEYGIGAMMSIAERHNVKLVMFLDSAEQHLYGDALLDVGREIVRRRHDSQRHIHFRQRRSRERSRSQRRSPGISPGPQAWVFAS